ncbi:MAG TPA: glycosyltransferase family 4 protein [Candidatus Eisenbacteria bacterium]
MLARGLARRGFEVSAVTCDYGQAADLTIDGVRLIRSHPPRGGIPVLRFFHPRLTRALRALAATEAEVYYARGLGVWAGEAYEVARWRRAAFVLGTAHDLDVRRDLPLHRSPRDRVWARRTLRGADAIVAQTEVQRALYREQFGRASELIPNLVEIPAAPVDPGRPGAVLWLATYKRSKRPEWVLELARRLPARRFVMCGMPAVPPDSPAPWDEARAAARACPNLEVRGYVGHDGLGPLFGEAALLLHTSPAEGFPNTMLEAWAHGVPVISVVDPDGAVEREGLGQTAGSLDELERTVERWMADPERRRAAGARARAHVLARHAPDRVLEPFASLLDRMVGVARARRSGRAGARSPAGAPRSGAV